MKRIVLILVAIMLLSGCAQQKGSVEPSTKSVPSAIHIAYMPNSAAEQETDGAIRMYAVSESVEQLELMNNGLVLIDSLGQIAVVSEQSGTVISSKSTEQLILSVQDDRVVTYVPETGNIIVLDGSLNQDALYTLKDGITGTPVSGQEEVFYCVDDHIRALNLESGLSRNVMQFVPGEQYLTGSFFNGEMIGWNDGGKVIYLSSKDGQVLFQDSQLAELRTGNNNYYGLYLDGLVQQYIWGTVGSDPMQIMNLQDQAIYPQMNSNSLISAKAEEIGYTISRYNMYSGKCTGQLTAKITGQILDVVDGDRYTWILTNEGLYGWDHEFYEYQDLGSCLAPLITAQNPDVTALEECADRAKKISEKFGIDIHVWEAALLNDETYVITGEYQAQVINQMLDAIEKQLTDIPEQLLKSTDEYCGVQICLVRSIEGHQFIQYRSESGLCIAITPDANMEEAFLTGLGWGIDSRIIGNSRDLDYWDDLNPAGFDYDYSYFVNEHRTDLEYLEGEYRAFVDKRSMSFPSEDRARIFYYAMTEGNEELFKSPVLQAKLKTLCEGIREAYGWQKEAQTFTWEQYLEESLAYN